MNIRKSLPAEKQLIWQLHREAFDESEAESVAQLAVDLMDDPTAAPVLSLVAEEGNTIVGHVLFTRVTMEGCGAEVFIMAPLAVAEHLQGHKVGQTLIEQGLQCLKQQGVDVVLVLGDPDYYTRHGFRAGHGLQAPYELQIPEAWMAQPLSDIDINALSGTVRCADALMSPEHWLAPDEDS